jgi:hypothetical protein
MYGKWQLDAAQIEMWRVTADTSVSSRRWSIIGDHPVWVFGVMFKAFKDKTLKVL